jgi:hypothetical protein
MNKSLIKWLPFIKPRINLLELVEMDYDDIISKSWGSAEHEVDCFGMRYYWWLIEFEIDVVVRNNGTWTSVADDWKWTPDLKIIQKNCWLDGREVNAIWLNEDKSNKLLNT